MKLAKKKNENKKIRKKLFKIIFTTFFRSLRKVNTARGAFNRFYCFMKNIPINLQVWEQNSKEIHFNQLDLEEENQLQGCSFTLLISIH